MASHSTSLYSSKVNFPDGIAFKDLPPLLAFGSPDVRGPMASDGLPDLLRDVDFIRDEAFQLRLEDGGAPINVDSVSVDVPVMPDEHAVVLVERDGAYTWRYPRDDGGPLGTRSGAHLRFDLDPASASEPDAPAPGTRGIAQDMIADWLGKAVRVYILRFAARIAVKHAASLLEPDVPQALVPITGMEAADWVPRPVHATDKPLRRILLLLHGTFSSTRGSFGALAVTESGRGFLAAAQARYDLVLGFDHRTLTQDPLQNAEALAQALGTLALSPDAEFDAIAFSRGGLVLRCFIEQVMSARLPELRARRAVFIGCTNGGTNLAQPRNWKRMLDLYTNLTLAGTRALGMLPGLGTGAAIVGQTMKCISAFVQDIATMAIDESRVPGIAAMRPDGQLVRQLNDAAVGNTDSEHPKYFWAGVSFDVQQGGAPGIVSGFHDYLMYHAASQMFQEPNDLVVDCAMMRNFGSHMDWVTDQRDLSSMDRLYHTIYFTSPELHDCLGEWLLDRSDVFLRLRSSFLLVDGESRIGDTLGQLGDDPLAPVVVLERRGVSIHYHLRRADELRAALAALDPNSDEDINAALRLTSNIDTQVDADEFEISHRGDLWKISNESTPRASKSASVARAVVLEHGELIGVVPDPHWSDALRTYRQSFALVRGVPLGASDVFVAGAQVGAMGHTGADELFGDDDAEVTQRRAPALAAPAPAARTDSFQCHFEAEMPSRPQLGDTVNVVFQLSREERSFQPGTAHRGGQAPVEADVPICVTARAIHNCKIEGEALHEVSAPEPGQPRIVQFQVRGLTEGPAEVWLSAAQDNRKLITIPLNPSFVADTEVMAVQADANLGGDEGGLIDLRIRDTSANDDGNVRLEYDLSSDDLQFMLFGQSVELNSQKRSAYIKGIYRDIESFLQQAAYSSQADPSRAAEFMRNFEQNLRLRGAALCDQLVPKEVRKELWTAHMQKKIGAVRVFTKEPSIPWEMLYLRDPEQHAPITDGCFLAELGLLRWSAPLGYPPSHVPIDCDLAYYLIPEYDGAWNLPGTSNDRQLLTHHFDAKPLEATTARMLELFGSGRFDLFHAGCHGEAIQGSPWEGGLLLNPRGLGGAPEYLREFHLQGHTGNRPLVFLNACQIGVPNEGMTGAAGLGIAFLSACKAAILVAPMWSVRDGTASLFAHRFYDRLVAGESLVAAVRHARKAAKEAGDPSWLAYSVWGHPYARIKLKRAWTARAPALETMRPDLT
ncbi:CHAT domain-containing protein [Burkholderia sp. Ac-20365]|uniref:CHAT domain-containing protein n=1 Tax=Burkholderia sp. Ac-20365 TaxID=2703897 RepID=UPI00197C0607|nr:CHAT domain-containing protein [Burkholderia sp. Ac-20365]MBN3759302.1 CHAT domain-containing protein [Burkholderia sp. Ac-20365]